MERDLGSGKSARALFSAEMVRLRRERGLSQSMLGKRLQVHRTLISHIERGGKPPQREIAEGLDTVFDLTEQGHFIGLYKRMVRDLGTIGWFLRWLEVEPRASLLRFWDPLLIPGFLQTEDYARAIFSQEPTVSAGEVEERVAIRMARRAILDRKEPPRVWIMMEESVLNRPIGGEHVLRDQLRHLLNMAEHPSVTLQVVPVSAGCAPGLLSAFALARVPDDDFEIATVQSAGDGVVTTDPGMITRLSLRCDTIRNDALSQHDSLRLIERAAEQWTK
ncbi:transcriptional regulator [Microtetraspora sp. NBRC 13810]|uniref:helix-turn-helix domain-containing protein n=1 Tax=Microtetraspora sp. NBRC 13810 TaxID=3030990 RepID=UPI0024A0B112|nr:helix-turn-helix transcriptional regulator [Microtetraspora sp. NBRC 13810]GLW06220.1 transcriptional regulator [Microtetraspora sp. NBRC 13810]